MDTQLQADLIALALADEDSTEESLRLALLAQGFTEEEAIQAAASALTDDPLFIPKPQPLRDYPTQGRTGNL